MHDRDSHWGEPFEIDNLIALPIVDVSVCHKIKIRSIDCTSRWQFYEIGAVLQNRFRRNVGAIWRQLELCDPGQA